MSFALSESTASLRDSTPYAESTPSLRASETNEAIHESKIDCHENSLRSFSRNDGAVGWIATNRYAILAMTNFLDCFEFAYANSRNDAVKIRGRIARFALN